jgi:dolichyl-phosphate beta-glucosyltransferase
VPTSLPLEPAKGVHLSVIIPAYNEAGRILPTLAAAVEYLAKQNYAWEIVVADDGSTDRTVLTVRAASSILGRGYQEESQVRVLDPVVNRGKGAAVRFAAQRARGDLILFTDADGSTPIQMVERLMRARGERHADVAIGSRAVEGANVENKSGLRKILSAGLRRYSTLVLGLSQADTQCGFKLFTREAADRLFVAQQIDGFAFDLELLYLAKRGGLTVVEVPVEWTDDKDSRVSPVKVAFEFVRDSVRIRRLHGRAFA